MTKLQMPKLFEDRKNHCRVDVVGALTDQPDTEHARNYWKVLKHRLKKEGNEPVTDCNRLKLTAEDGKLRLTE